MARNIEDWTDGRIPNLKRFLLRLVGLPNREMVILCASILDSLLADLISSALVQDQKEIEDFVGIDGDGRAPVGSFGARIQACYLMRLISKEQRDVLRAIKDVRNVFSHRALASFADPKVVAKVKRIFEIHRDHEPRRKPNRVYPTKEEFVSSIESSKFVPDACYGIYLSSALVEVQQIRRKIRGRRRKRRQKP